MKRGTCPKCKSVDILDATPIERRADGHNSPLNVATYGDPGALIFKDARKTTLSACVCGNCGYTELYADVPTSLKP